MIIFCPSLAIFDLFLVILGYFWPFLVVFGLGILGP